MKTALGFIFFLPVLLLGQQREFSFYIEKKDSIVTLQLASVETFPCVGYSIRTREMWDHDTLIIEIRGFIKPTPCYRNVDAAKKVQEIIGIRSKQFTIKLRWGEKVDLWTIDISSDAARVKEKQVSFTSWFRD